MLLVYVTEHACCKPRYIIEMFNISLLSSRYSTKFCALVCLSHLNVYLLTVSNSTLIKRLNYKRKKSVIKLSALIRSMQTI